MRLPPLRTLATLAALAVLAAPLVACGSSSGDGAGGSAAGASSGEPAEMSGITAAHNAVRAAVSPPASPPSPPNQDLARDGSLRAYYTQVVWRDSPRLCCGVADCASGAPSGAGPRPIWVCDYAPPGDYAGEKPY